MRHHCGLTSRNFVDGIVPHLVKREEHKTGNWEALYLSSLPQVTSSLSLGHWNYRVPTSFRQYEVEQLVKGLAQWRPW